jgi:signal peptidase II
VFFLVLAAGSLAADLVSKQRVFAWLLDDPRVDEAVAEIQLRHGPQVTTEEALVLLRRRGLLQRPILPGVQFVLSTNPGVVFGLRMPPWTVLIATALTIGLVGYFFAVSPASAHGLHVGLALILGGALGNLYDRLLAEVAIGQLGAAPIRREVRDFIDCSGLHYPWVFNVADALLVAGVGLLMVHWWRAGRKAAGSAAA